MEDAQRLGLVPSAATIGGVRFDAKRQDKQPEPKQMDDGNFYRFDAVTGQMVKVPIAGQPSAAVADPSNAIRAILQSRQK